MTNASEVIAALQTQLTDDSTLSAYVKGKVLLGDREGVTIYPVIILEPMELLEADRTYPEQQCTLSVEVYGCVNVKDKDVQLIGDANTKGIMEMENDVKAAISADRTLGISGSDVWARITRTDYDRRFYPLRFFRMVVEIDFRQNSSSRA